MDDYPSDEQLKQIADWPLEDLPGAFVFIKALWHWPEFGIAEEDGVLYLATGGWSGNESIIGAMQENLGLWHRWICSTRGGAHEFELQTGMYAREPRFKVARELRTALMDLHQGFMTGAYARLKELQETERRVADLDAKILQLEQELRTVHGTYQTTIQNNLLRADQRVLEVQQKLDAVLILRGLGA